MTTPTIEQAIKSYTVFAAAERMKTGCPGEGTVANTVHGTKNVCEAAGIALESTVDAFTRKAIDNALVTFVGRGLSRITAWTYVCRFAPCSRAGAAPTTARLAGASRRSNSRLSAPRRRITSVHRRRCWSA